MSTPLGPVIKLFYSYSHQDASYRTQMEKSLSLLEASGLTQWSDEQIMPGTAFSPQIKSRMDSAHILVFLMSRDFIQSEACRAEWEYGKELANRNGSTLIPIVLRKCPWQDFDTMADRLALPNDGAPITSFADPDDAWHQVYVGIKRVVEDLRNEPHIRPAFIRDTFRVDFISVSRSNISPSELFEFPVLRSSRSPSSTSSNITSIRPLLGEKRILIHGDVLSGKSALCGHILEHFARTSTPAIYVDLANYASRPPTIRLYREIFETQATGSFDRWASVDPCVILDNLTGSNRATAHLKFCADHFQRVVASAPSDIFFSYFAGDDALPNFTVMEIAPLSHVKQERIIKRWLALSNPLGPTDGDVDRLEAEVNSIIVDNRILPRYPYYVLAILQMREGFMPKDISVTAYGHCHYALILAHLIKAGIDKEDSEINSCFNLASQFAFFLYRKGLGWNAPVTDAVMNAFLVDYADAFILADRTLSRITHPEFGIIRRNQFKGSYMYYYFLGKYLADHQDSSDIVSMVETMAERCYVADNAFTLMSLVHHSANPRVIDDLVVRNLCSLDHVPPATLQPEETEAIRGLLESLPSQLAPADSIEAERVKEREARDSIETQPGRSRGGEASLDRNVESDDDFVNDIYRILKCNEILGQIVRNRYGNLTKTQLAAIISSIKEGGLRLLRLFLLDEEQVRQVAVAVMHRQPGISEGTVKQLTGAVLLQITISLLERIVDALNKREVRGLVESEFGHEPADEVLRFMTWLDADDRFRLVGSKAKNSPDVRHLQAVWDEQADEMVRRIISIATQRYVNTHQTAVQARQALLSLLGVA